MTCCACAGVYDGAAVSLGARASTRIVPTATDSLKKSERGVRAELRRDARELETVELVVHERAEVLDHRHRARHAGLTQFIYTHGGRILYHDQYVDAESNNHYYTRLKWDVSSFATTDEEMAERLQTLIGSGPETEWSLHYSDEVFRMAVFVSKDPWCLYDILARSLSGEWTVEKQLTVLNKPNGRIAYRFHARDLHLVMGPAAPGTSRGSATPWRRRSGSTSSARRRSSSTR